MEQTPKHCPDCGTELECKLQDFSIGADGGGGLMSLLADQYEVDLYACPQCGRVLLYTASSQFQPLSKQLEQRAQNEEAVTCPVCGTKHSPLIGCPNCALHGTHTPLSSPDPKPRKKKTRKPPWER